MAGNKVYLAGATGRLGSEVLKKTGAIPLVRKPGGLKGEVVTDFSVVQLRSILADAKAVLDMAGSVDTLDVKKMREANVELTAHIVEAMPKGCRIILASSISVYGKRMAETPADEGTPVNPDSAYAKSKYEAEKIAASCPDHVILRIGTIYGPQFGDYYRVLERIEKGKMAVIGDGGNRIPFVHVGDVADAAAAALNKGKGTYVIAGDALLQKEIFEIAARELGVAAPSKHAGLRTALLAAFFGELAYRLGGKKPSLTREHVGVLGYDRAFDCSKARKELGFSPRPLEKGIIEMVRDYKRRTAGNQKL